MADRRTKEALLAELRMVYEENDLLKLRVAELESHVHIEKITAGLEDLFQRVKATLPNSDAQGEKDG